MTPSTESRSHAPAGPHPGLVPCTAAINYTFWAEHGARLDELQTECPNVRLHGKAAKDSPRAVEHTWRDAWGCLWHFPGMYLDGVVVEHPLDSWDKLDSWRPPSPAEHIEQIRHRAEQARREGRRPPGAGMEHGFLFLRLTYLRGFNNFMLDVAERDPRIYQLRDIVADYWQQIVEAHLDCGTASVGGGDDLGLQDRLPISPAAWRDLIKPGLDRIFRRARQSGARIHLHTDGYIVDIIPDLIELGVTSLNPQDLVNGLDNLARLAKGKLHIALDVDRQRITVFGTAPEIDEHIHNCIRTLGSPRGGLSLTYGVYPGTPVENVEATVRAMQKYHDLWAGGQVAR